MLGGAAYTYPQYFLNKYPESKMTVVEIDPKMTKLAEKYFDLDPYRDNLEIIHQDARIFLAKNKKKYDIIYGDAFSSYYSPPFHLTTIEALKSLKDSLKPDGMAVINIISALQGEKSTFFVKEFNTLEKLFSNIIVFYTEDRDSFDKVQNIVLVCSNDKSLNRGSFASLDKKWSDNIYYNLMIEGRGILTDNFAPVEYYNLN
jgi:spermidine synthase